MQSFRAYAAWIVCCLLVTSACSSEISNVYRPYSNGLLYSDLGLEKQDPAGRSPSDPVLPGSFCSALGVRAMRNATLQTTFGYITSFVAASLVAAGAIWGSVADDSKQKKTAVLAFPAAGVALVPMSTYLFNRSRRSSVLAAEATAGASSDLPGKDCNAALVKWHNSRDTDVGTLAASMEKARDDVKTPDGAVKKREEVAAAAVDSLAAAVKSAPVTLTQKASAELESATTDAMRRLSDFEVSAFELAPEKRLVFEDLTTSLRSKLDSAKSLLEAKQRRTEEIAEPPPYRAPAPEAPAQRTPAPAAPAPPTSPPR